MSSSRGRGSRIPRRLAGLFTSRDSSTVGGSSTLGSSSTPAGSSTPRDFPQTSTGSAGMSVSVRDLSLGSIGDGPATPGVTSTTTTQPAAPRTTVTLAPDESLASASTVAHAIENIIKGIVDDEGYAWRFVSEDTNALYFAEFQKLFCWDPSIEAQVQAKFYSNAAERYKDWVCKAKARRSTKGRPQVVSKWTWTRWCAYWDLDSTREVSRQAKKNRLADVDGPDSGPSTHREGSRSSATYAASLSRERGVPISETFLETFYRIYRPNGVYTDPKSARIRAEVDRIFTEWSQPLPDGTIPEVDKNVIYVQVAHRHDKGRVFGLGSMYTGSTQDHGAASTWDSSATSQSEPPVPPEVVLELRQEVDRLRAKADEADELRALVHRLEEDQRRVEVQNKQMFDDIMHRIDSQPPPHP